MSAAFAGDAGPAGSAPGATARSPEAVEHAISRIRHRSFRALRLAGTIVAIPHVAYVLAVMSRDPALRGLTPLVAALEVAVVAGSWLFTERTYRIGAGIYIFAVSLLACLLLWTVGMTVGTGLAFAWVCVAASVFHGMRVGVLAFCCVAVELLAYGLWRHLGGVPGPWPGAVLVSTPILVRYSLALLGLIGMLLATVSVVVEGFEAAMREVGMALVRERTEQEARQAVEAERLQLERSLRGVQKMESIGRLAGGVVHDVNNALAVILSCVGELAPAVPEDRRADVEAIASAARSSSVLTRRLLSLARQTAGDVKPVEIPAVLRLLADVLQRTMPKCISVVVQEGPETEGELVAMGDRSDVEHALLNLALNARDAMPKGGTLTLSYQARTLTFAEAAGHPGVSPGRFVELAVQDTGTGIAPDYLPRIFEPLFTTRASEEGTGLGLSSVHSVVRRHRGAIEVRTELGRGTRFTLLLPAAPPGPPAAEDGAPSGAPGPLPRPGAPGSGDPVRPARPLDQQDQLGQ